MPYSVSAFQQLLEPLDRRMLKRIVAQHDGDHGVGSGPNAWGCIRHLKTMLFAQFTGLGSLREIEHGLSAQPNALYHLDLRLVRRSTFADALAHRPWQVFSAIGQALLAQANRAMRKQGMELIELIDSSPIPLREARFGWAEKEGRTRGLKLHMGYDPRFDVPVWMDVSSAKVSDITAARARPVRAGTVLVFDKGYLDFGWWHRLHGEGALFVSRLKRNTYRREVSSRTPEGIGILEDNDLKIGHAKPRGGATNPLFEIPLREILVERDGKEPLRLITNDLNRSAAEIAALYKERWQIELMFKWIKQNLKIKRFIGRSENAVRIQIFVALIAYLLLRMFRQTQAKSHRDSAKTLIARLRVALMQPLNLTNRAKPPPRQPAQLSAPPQLNLALASR